VNGIFGTHSVIDLSRQEYCGLPEFDKAAAVEDVKEALVVADLSDAVLLAVHADPLKLAASVRGQSGYSRLRI